MILNKINTELLNSLHENISDPFLVLDTNGNIVLFNKQASIVLGLKSQQNIYDVLDKDSSEKFHGLFQNVINNNVLEKTQLFLTTNSGRDLNSVITLNSFRSDDEFLLFCTIKIQSYNISTGDVTSFQVKNDANEIINNPKVISILDEIKSSYPFTLTSKERIRKLINEIDELFWIKNTEGVYVIANNKVAETIGINFNQIEGKNENSFIPTYLINFHLLLDQYVRETLNCIVVEGVRLNGFSNSKKYQTIEIPLLDSDNNLAAIVCIGQKIENNEKIILQQDIALEDKKLILKGELFEKLFHKNPLPVFIVDKENLEFFDVNEPAIKLYGYTKEEFLNKDLTDLYSQEDIQTLLDSSVENLKEGVFYGPYNHKKKDGSIILVEIAKISIKFNERDANLTIVTDVTEKNQMEKNNQIYKASFDNSTDLLFITDPSGFITFINSAVENNLGYSLKDLENTSFTALLQNDERAEINNKIFKQKPIDMLSFELELKNSDENFIETNLKVVPLFNYKKEIDNFSIIAEVIKPEKVIEIEKAVPLPEAVNSNQIPLSNVFHEILTPINVILGFVQELTENKKDLTNEQKEAVDIINHNRVTLLNTMNSIIEYSKLEAENSKLKIEDVKITDVIDKLHKEFSELKGTRKVDFAYGKISSSLIFKSDKQKFQYLISLLLMMGIQMSKEEKIYLSAYQINGNNFAIIIKDNYNFTSQELLTNFDSIFEQGDFAAGKNFGISKYTFNLTKKLLSILHCEKQIIDSGKPEGKEFAFIFPINLNYEETREVKAEVEPVSVEENEKNKNQLIQEKQSSDKNDEISFEQEKISAASKINEKNDTDILVEEVAVKESLDLSKLNCLYIEDQIDSQILFKVQMKELRKVKFALNFENAIPMLERERFDFIVIDINLPGDYNGLDALKIIHQSPGFENIPIIAVSAYLSASEKEKFIAAGFSDFISKPLFKDKLYESLNKIF